MKFLYEIKAFVNEQFGKDNLPHAMLKSFLN